MTSIDPVFTEFERSLTARRRLTLFVKRALDLLISVISLILLSPVFIVIAVLVKCDSRGPVLFKQRRIGRFGREYEMLKFRTMCMGAESMSAGLYSFAGDSRITRVGDKLRSTSLDELPQLINVLLGSMSLVGPRPPVTYELGDFDTLNLRYKKRFRVKPGITGLAQAEGRNDIPWDKKVNYDNLYIERLMEKGISVDFSIFLKTLGNIFRSEGIVEAKIDDALDDAAAAEAAEREIIRLAHQKEADDE